MPEHSRAAGPRRWRLAGVLAGGALLLWITVGITFAQVAGAADPVTALRLWPVAAAPRAAQASLAIARDPSPATLATARTQAVHVLLDDPVDVPAALVAGLATVDADQVRGRRMLLYAQELSRRDLGTQVALIQVAVADGEVAGALHHYDIALRTHYTSDQLLMPVLVKASANPPVAAALRPMLAHRPPWRLQFVYGLLTAQPWAPDVASLIEAARLDRRDPQERDFLNRALKGLVANGAVGDAARLYAQATHLPVAASVRDGGFTADNRIAPFDWDIADEPGLGAVSGPVDRAPFAQALSLNADPGRSGVVARQLLVLGTGRYRLRFVTGSVAAGGGDRSGVSLACAGTGTPLADVRLPRGMQPHAVETMVNVPADCSSQWLSIQAGTDIDTPRNASSSPWISAVAVRSITDKGRTNAR